MRSAIDRLVALEHPDPHAVLGAHGRVVRAWLPDAESAELLADGKERPMKRVHDAGIFEARGAAPYRLRARYPGGDEHTFDDPYAFWPTIGELDLHLFAEGQHWRLYEKLGARALTHQGVDGVAFAVWAPSARGVSVVGDFNGWDGRRHPMRAMGASGIWELFVPGADGAYKFEIRPHGGPPILKADPFAQQAEVPPKNASLVFRRAFEFSDQEWMESRARAEPAHAPMSIYELHLGSWRGPLPYRELAAQAAGYVKDLGFTHVQLMPVMEHPYGGSWGYQVTGYFAPTSRFGGPDDLRAFIDHFHREGIGVILDWVPAHFPMDIWALGRFDGTALYEHLDPRQGQHPDWGTFVFNYGRTEVRNFLISNALFWLREFHADGLRLDAVASMLYRDYSRPDGQWVPNRFGGRENLEAIDFLRRLNEVAHAQHPGVLMVAEESTAWPGVSRPTYLGGLGFGFKWNMGWMHDTLRYFSKNPIHRRFHHNNLTFGLLYAWSENFILPLSHDEVVHGKRSLAGKMPGDGEAKLANLRALYAYLWAHPGKKLLFMGGEFGQWREWNHDAPLDWGLLDFEPHAGVRRLVSDLNRAYRARPALWRADGHPDGFEWIDANAADDNVVAFIRRSGADDPPLVCVGNLSGAMRTGYRVGLPAGGAWREVVNTDAAVYGGGNAGNLGLVAAEEIPFHGRAHSAALTLPPLSVLWLEPAS